MRGAVRSSQESPKKRRSLPVRRTAVASRVVPLPYGEVAQSARICLPGLIPEALPWRDGTPYDSVASVSLDRLHRFVRVPVDIELSSPPDSRSGVVAKLRWHAHNHTGLFPVMHAELLARPGDPGSTTLVLTGTYRPPFGLLGLVGDVLAGRNVARSTARAFLGAVSDALERAVREGRCAPRSMDRPSRTDPDGPS